MDVGDNFTAALNILFEVELLANCLRGGVDMIERPCNDEKESLEILQVVTSEYSVAQRSSSITAIHSTDRILPAQINFDGAWYHQDIGWQRSRA